VYSHFFSLSLCFSKADEITKLGGQAFTYRCNVGDFTSVQQLGERVKQEVRTPVDIIINNAGIVSGKRILDLSEEMVVRTMNVNTLAHIWFYKVFLPDMLARRSGHIVNVISAAGIVGTAGLVDYCASKFGAFGAHEALRLELFANGQDFIATTAVCKCGERRHTGSETKTKKEIEFL
jgi:all-trans-retinol dehydrogenase (NAD+)